MSKIAVLIMAFAVGFIASLLAGFFTDKAVFMGQFILTLGIILYADVIYEIREIKSEVNKNGYSRKKSKS